MTDQPPAGDRASESHREDSRDAAPGYGTEQPWTVDSAAAVYEPHAWGDGYFVVRPDGTMGVRPRATPEHEVDLHEVVRGLDARGLTAPLIVRFPEILSDRLRRVHGAFRQAIQDNGYRGDYIVAYPIKVNHQRSVVEALTRRGKAFGCGLEVGSKPELLAALALTADRTRSTPIICNGFKDSSYLQAVVLASKLGREIVPVVETLDELDLLIGHARRYGVCPQIGVRARLDARGSGRWQASTGAGSKFGLSATELVRAVEMLQGAALLDRLRLVHGHAGSQLQDIRSVKDTVGELTHVYGELLRLGAPMNTIDVGGGLAVDYDGSRAGSSSSMNYSLEEYASEVVYRIGAICDGRDIDHPRIVSESGRALVAHHSILIFEVVGVTSGESFVGIPASGGDFEAGGEVRSPDSGGPSAGGEPQVIRDLRDAYASVDAGRLLESFHDAEAARSQAIDLFALGYLTLEVRGLAERLFWSICSRVQAIARTLDRVPAELQVIDEILCDTYHGNLSIFQSLPDAWAIGQRFPIMPIHRLDERPCRDAVLADMTCDSDGRIDAFPGSEKVRQTLRVHELHPGEPYYLGAFLVGAYQETLGDLHNLFGDTHVAQLRVSGSEWYIDEVVRGDTARDVLRYVQYDPDRLQSRMAQDCERAIRRERMTVQESRALLRFYESELGGYTYLTDAPEG